MKKMKASVLNGILRLIGKAQYRLYMLYGKIKAITTPIDYESRDDDIFICTYPKSGTTWVQMILYQLTGDGELNHPHISLAIPDVEMDVLFGPGDIRQYKPPRILKTHQPYESVLKGSGRYIYVVRDGRDVAVSYFHHYRYYRGYNGTFDEFVELFLKGQAVFGNWADHVAGWRKNPDNLNVLYLSYEELVEDLEAGVRKIAGFCNIPISDDQMPRILERCGFEFMKENQYFFDLAVGVLVKKGFRNKREFIRSGKAGEGRTAMNADQLKAYADTFNQKLEDLELDQYRQS